MKAAGIPHEKRRPPSVGRRRRPTRFAEKARSRAFSIDGYVNDAVGRRTSMSRSGSAYANSDTISYTYNDRSELTGAVSNVDTAYSYSYAYDPIGNRVTASEAGVSWTYTTNSLNQYTSATENNVQMSFSYDQDGSMTYRPVDATSGWTQIWNAENRMVETSKGTDRLTFKYDYMGRRVEKCVYSGNTLASKMYFVYDGFKCVEELDGLDSNAVVMRHAWQPFDVGLDVILATTDGNGTSYFLHDGGKNVAQATRGDGSMKSASGYRPYGEEGGGARGYAFSSEHLDPETDLQYYLYRYYDPTLGKWLGRDPVEESEGSPGLYAFVVNNPIDYYDSLGLIDISLESDSISIDLSSPPSPNGLSLYGSVSASFGQCPLTFSGKLEVGVKWEPPGLKRAKNLLEKFEISLEAGLKGGGFGTFSYSECSGLSDTKVCFRIEAFAKAKYGTQELETKKHLKKLSLGVELNGGCGLCVNLCNGEITADCSVSYEISMQAAMKIGARELNISYKKEDLISGSKSLGRYNSLALLEPYCNRPANPNSCCCQK